MLILEFELEARAVCTLWYSKGKVTAGWAWQTKFYSTSAGSVVCIFPNFFDVFVPNCYYHFKGEGEGRQSMANSICVDN